MATSTSTIVVLVILNVLLNFSQPGKCFPGGAPISDSLCKNMLPIHPGGQLEDPKTNPYSILVEPKTITAGDTVKVTISGKNGEPFQGFLLLGRSTETGLLDAKGIHGTFKAAPRDAQTGTCFNMAAVAATHVSKSEKKSITLEWKAPPYGDGSYWISGTVLKAYDSYWGNILSDEIKVTKRSGGVGMDSTLQPLIPSPTVPTRPPKAQTTLTADYFYNRCQSSGCFTVPPGCLDGKSCKMMAAFGPTENGNDIFKVQLMGKPLKMTHGYISVGISQDDTMGGDAVFGCYFDGTQVQAMESINADGDKRNRAVQENEKSLISSRTALIDDYLICEFEIQSPIHISSSKNGEINITFSGENFLLFARGPAKPTNFGFHPMSSIWVSERAVKLSDAQKITEQSRVLFQAHGSLLIIAWVLIASVGTFTSRYYKQTFGDYSPFGKALWFVIHQSCMVTALLLTIAGIALMIAQMKGISKMESKNKADVAHPIIGFVLLGLVMLQVVLALCRPDPSAGVVRKIFNWIHFIIGNTSYILAFVCIFLAWELSKARFDGGVYGLLNYKSMLIVFLVFHLIAHLFMSAHTFLMDWKYGEENNTDYRGITPAPMKHSASQMEPRGSGYRTTMLLVEICVAAFITGYLVVEVCNS